MPRALPDIADLTPLDGAPLRFAWEASVVGARYHGAEGACLRLRPGDEVDLVREPENAHDANAIRVEHGGELLGYLPAEFARAWAGALDAGVRTRCEVLRPTQKNTVREDVAVPLVWVRFYAREQRYELCDMRYRPPSRNPFDGGWSDPPEHCFYLADDDPAGRHRLGDVIVSADEKTVVGLPGAAEPPAVLAIPEGVREIAPWACAQSGAGGVVLPDTLEQIHQFAFAEASGWLVRVPAGVRHVASGAFATRATYGEGWRPCYFEVDGANEHLCSREGSLLGRAADGLELLSLYADLPSHEHDDPELPSAGVDYRVPEGTTRVGAAAISVSPMTFSPTRLLAPELLGVLDAGSFSWGTPDEGVVVDWGGRS